MARQRLKGKRALVTGASSGLGAELARTLAAEGANLVIVARREARLAGLKDEIEAAHGVEVHVEVLDLTQPDAAVTLHGRTEGADLAIDVLVNNAGFGDYRNFLEIEWDRHAGMIQLNVTVLTQLTHLFLPQMIARGHGHVMNIASMAAYLPSPRFAAYAASKAYVRDFTEAIDYELGGTGVRAICICPGGTRTEFLEQAGQTLKRSGELAMMTAARCAQIAVDKMLAGRRTVITGFTNVLSSFFLRFVPRRWLPAIAKLTMDAGVEQAPRAQPITATTPEALPGPCDPTPGDAIE